jgi:hypothetical protein
MLLMVSATRTVNILNFIGTVNKDGGLVKTELAPSLSTAPSLTTAQVIQLLDIALDLENEFDMPQGKTFECLSKNSSLTACVSRY